MVRSSTLLTSALLVTSVSAFTSPRVLKARSSSAVAPSMASAFHSVTDTDTDGNEVSFSEFEGKVAYCVNVASA